MTDRNALDRPASVTAALFGVLLIGISIPLLMVLGGPASGGNSYSVTWSEGSHGAATGTQGAANAAQVVRVAITDALVSNVTLAITCTDTRGPGNVAPAATVTWTLTYLNRTQSGTACGVDERYNVSAHPDIAQVEAESAEAAYASLWNRPGFENKTGEAVLTFTWNRPTGQVPLPQQGTGFTATLALGVLQWNAAVEAATAPEVVR